MRMSSASGTCGDGASGASHDDMRASANNHSKTPGTSAMPKRNHGRSNRPRGPDAGGTPLFTVYSDQEMRCACFSRLQHGLYNDTV